MASNKYERKRGSCGGTLKRNGRTSAGTRRWRCRRCGASSVMRRPARQDAWRARTWLAWLLADRTLGELGVSMRSFQRHTRRFWLQGPAPVFDGLVHDVLVVDATRIGAAMCHVVAAPPARRAQGRNGHRATVVAWGMIRSVLGRADGPHPAPESAGRRCPERHRQGRGPMVARCENPDPHRPFRATCMPRPDAGPTSSPWPSPGTLPR